MNEDAKAELNREGKPAEPVGPPETLKKERDEYLDGWKRAKADLINYKKEETERMREFVKYANEAMITDLLNVMDSFDLGITALPGGDPGKKGMVVIRAQFHEILRKYGVEILTAENAAPFNPAREEAVGEIESTAPPGTVAGVVRSGYTVNGRVVRPVQVTISKSQNKINK